jgi:hypothetical protein
VQPQQAVVGRTVIRRRGITTDWRRRYEAEQSAWRPDRSLTQRQEEEFLRGVMDAETRALKRVVKRLTEWLLQELKRGGIE